MRKIKLSTAILKGCKKSKKAVGMYHNSKGNRTCALGAALLGIGLDPWSEGGKESKHWSILNNKPFPLKGSKGWTLWGQIIFLNDSRLWSRQRIARWLKKKGL